MKRFDANSFHQMFILQEVNAKVEQHKEIIESNTRGYNEMKAKKDELQNERRWDNQSIS